MERGEEWELAVVGSEIFMGFEYGITLEGVWGHERRMRQQRDIAMKLI